MMSNVLAATYPEQIQALSLYSGVPAGCFMSSSGGVDQWNSSCASGQVSATAEAWGNTARNMYPGYNGTRPRMQIWHGSADSTLNPQNYKEEIKVSRPESRPMLPIGPARATNPSRLWKGRKCPAGTPGSFKGGNCVWKVLDHSDSGYCSNGRMSSASARRPPPRSKTIRRRTIRLIITVRMFKASMPRVLDIVYRLI